MPLVKSKNSVGPVAAEHEATLEEALIALASVDPQERRRAARRLGDLPEAAPALCSMVEAEAQESVRVSIFTALILIGTKAAASGLIPLLKTEDVGLRNGAIEALKTMPDSSAECISEIFASSTDVRIFGVEILGALHHPDRQSWLLQVIEADSELNVCAAAVEALLDCGTRVAIAPLHELLARFPDEPFLDFSIRAAIERIESTE
jgi:HEAT repeat protein